MPFADPIAVGPTYEEDHGEALLENGRRDFAWEMDQFVGALLIDRDHAHAIVENCLRDIQAAYLGALRVRLRARHRGVDFGASFAPAKPLPIFGSDRWFVAPVADHGSGLFSPSYVSHT